MNYIDNRFFDPLKNIYPVTYEMLRGLYPNTSFPSTINDEFLAFLGLVRVVSVTKPDTLSMTHDVIESTPIKRGNEYYQEWKISDLQLTQPEQHDRLSVFKVEKKQELAAFRFQLETNGITVGGVEIKTDRESQAQLVSAVMTLSQGMANSINWKSSTGWVNFNLAQLQKLSKVVVQHVQGCFNVEQMHAQNIDNCETAEQLKQYDINLGWPSTAY